MHVLLLRKFAYLKFNIDFNLDRSKVFSIKNTDLTKMPRQKHGRRLFSQ